MSYLRFIVCHSGIKKKILNIIRSCRNINQDIVLNMVSTIQVFHSFFTKKMCLMTCYFCYFYCKIFFLSIMVLKVKRCCSFFFTFLLSVCQIRKLPCFKLYVFIRARFMKLSLHFAAFIFMVLSLQWNKLYLAGWGSPRTPKFTVLYCLCKIKMQYF